MVEGHSAKTASDIGRLYACISLVQGIGSLVTALGMAWALRLGIRLGERWLGLPFAFAAVLLAVVAVVVFSIKIKNV